jgi:hypothetical protein
MIIPSQHASRVARTAAGGGGGGSDFTANEFNFNNVFVNQGFDGSTNTVTMPHGGTLAISMNASLNGEIAYIYKNGVSQTAYTTSALSTVGNWGDTGLFASFAVSNGDAVYFYYENGYGNPVTRTVSVRNATFAGTLVDEHTIQLGGEGD